MTAPGRRVQFCWGLLSPAVVAAHVLVWAREYERVWRGVLLGMFCSRRHTGLLGCAGLRELSAFCPHHPVSCLDRCPFRPAELAPARVRPVVVWGAL